MEDLCLPVGRGLHAVLLVGHLHPVSLRPVPFPLPWLFGIARQQGDLARLAIDSLIDRAVAIEHRVPELVALAVGMYTYIGVLHLSGILAPDGEGPLVVFLRYLFVGLRAGAYEHQHCSRECY